MTSDHTNASEDQPQRPTDEDPAAWRAYWQALGQPWLTEPEIDDERKEELEGRRGLTPHLKTREYPFQWMKLRRRDVEWLLNTH